MGPLSQKLSSSHIRRTARTASAHNLLLIGFSLPVSNGTVVETMSGVFYLRNAPLQNCSSMNFKDLQAQE